jgi:hypothetical protein
MKDGSSSKLTTNFTSKMADNESFKDKSSNRESSVINSTVNYSLSNSKMDDDENTRWNENDLNFILKPKYVSKKFSIENYILLLQELKQKIQFTDYNNYFYFFLTDNLKKIKESSANKSKLIEKYTKRVEDHLVEMNYRDKLVYFFTNLYKDDGFKPTNENNVIEDFTISLMIYQKITNNSSDYKVYDLEQFNINSENIIPVTLIITDLSFVKKLNLSSNKIGKEGMWAIVQILRNSKSLKSLDISFTFIDEKILEYLNSLLDKNPYEKFELRKLNFSYNDIDKGRCAEYLANFVSKCHVLKRLNISKSGIGEGMIYILSELEKNRNFQTLIATSCKLDAYSINYLSKMLLNEMLCISEIVLSDNNLNNYGGRNLIKSLSRSKVIEIIMINCELNEKICKEFPVFLRVNRGTQSVNISNNKLEKISFLKEITACVSYNIDDKENKESKDNKMNFKDVKENIIEKIQKNQNFNCVLKNLDISKQKSFKMNYFDNEFLNLMKNITVKIFDISNNVNYDESTPKFKTTAQQIILESNTKYQEKDRDKETNINDLKSNTVIF